MKLTLDILDKRHKDGDRHWPGYLFGRVRTSTVVLIVAFLAAWSIYDTYRPPPAPQPAPPQFVPPGFVPDPNYTWVPRSQVQPPPVVRFGPTPTTTVPAPATTTPPVTTTTTTEPPPFVPPQLPCLLPPPFCPPSTTPTPPTTSPPPEPSQPGPGPAPAAPRPAR
ncbi:MAG: hypothetical protein PHQ28_04610 [Mycobacterium sp.]|nr:hypothetical protein [Mycobacterium sp.]